MIVGYSLVFCKRISKGYLKADEAEGELSSTVQENITGVRGARLWRERDSLKNFFGGRTTITPISDEARRHDDSVFWSLSDVMSMAQVRRDRHRRAALRVGRNHAGHLPGVRQLHAPTDVARPRTGAHAVGDEQGGRFYRPSALYPWARSRKKAPKRRRRRTSPAISALST